MNMGVQISLWDPDLNSFGTLPRSGIAGSYGNFIFNFLKKLHTVFHNGFSNLRSHQQCSRVPVSPHLLQHFYLFDIASLTIVKRYFIVALICVLLIIKHADHLCIPVGYLHVFFGEMFITVLCPFLIGLFIFLLLSCRNFLYTYFGN